MATYEYSYPITVPLVSIGAEAELGQSPFQISIPLVSYEVDQDYYEVQNVAGAFLYDASGPTYTDYTDEANDAAAGDVPLIPASPDIGDGFVVGAATKFDFLTVEVGTAKTGTCTFKYYYWNGSVWDELVAPDDLVYETINHWIDTWLVRLTLKIQPADWSAVTINGKYFYPLFIKYDAGLVGVQPLADQMWTGLWSVAHTQEWDDSLAIDDTGEGALTWVQGHTKSFSDNIAVDDTGAGALSWVQDFARSFSDTLNLSDGFAFANSMVRSWYDNMLLTDSLIKDVSKVFADLVTITELIYLGTNLFIRDVLGITDQLVFTVNRLFNDTVVIADMLIRDVNKVFQDNMTLADMWDKSPSAHWFDVIDIADTLYKSLSIVEPPSDVVETLTNPSLLTGPWMPYIAIGTSNITQDQVIGRITALFAEVYRKKANVRVISNTYFASAEFGQDEPTADDLLIYEIGLFDAPENGNMAARWVLSTPISKDNIDEFVIETAITVLHGSMYRQELSFTGDVGSEMIASILAAGGSSVAGAKDTQTMSDTLTWKLNDVDI